MVNTFQDESIDERFQEWDWNIANIHYKLNLVCNVIYELLEFS